MARHGTPFSNYRPMTVDEASVLATHAAHVGANGCGGTVTSVVTNCLGDGVRDRFVRELPTLFSTNNAQVTVVGWQVIVRMLRD